MRLPVSRGDTHQPLASPSKCGDLVAPDRMRARHRLRPAVRLALVEAILVLGVERSAAAHNFENAAQALVVLDQQRRRLTSR